MILGRKLHRNRAELVKRQSRLNADDLKRLGMDVQVVPMEFRALVDRMLNSKDYEAILMNVVNSDVDPTPEMNLWLSSGETHLWDLGEAKPGTPWEAELDRLMQAQLETSDFATRKRLYDRAQEIIAQNHYRPRDPAVAAKYAASFAKVALVTVDQAFGGWQTAQKTHFADGGTFDQIYRPGGR